MLQKIHFRVVHVTSQDEGFPAKELNHHSPKTKGWRSVKHCPYPQQIVVELECSARIRKIQILSHQYLIASRIAFYIGDSWGDDTINMETSRFLRLGHIELSDNESTNFRARELKSVHVDATGSCFQLFLYKNYPNKFNLQNQIGLVALNFIGEVAEPYFDRELPRDTESVRSDYVSPIDDLAFDVYQDPRLADVLRRLQAQKLEYARRENFELARQARDAIRRLQEAGEQIFQLELEKQEAAKAEDYETAKTKKELITEIRNNLSREIDLNLLLGPTRGSAYSRETRQRSTGPFLPPLLQKTRETYKQWQKPAPQYQEEDEAPPAIATALTSKEYDEECLSQGVPRSSNQADERPLPALVARQDNNSNVGELAEPLDLLPPTTGLENLVVGDEIPITEQSNMDGGPLARLSEASAREAAVAIDVVGLPLVTKAYSKSWRHREEALNELERRVCGPTLAPPAALANVAAEPDPPAELRSTTFLLRRALNDQVLTVYRHGLNLINPTIVVFGEKHGLTKQDIIASLDRLVPLLIQKTGDTSARIRDVTKAFLIEMAQWPILRHGSNFWHDILRPFPPTFFERLALSRVEIATELYALLGSSRPKSPPTQHPHGGAIPSGGLTDEGIITFAAHALEHRSNEVRDLAEALMVALYRSEDRNLVRRLLPANDQEAQRQPLYRRLFAKFDRLDGYEPSAASKPVTNTGSQAATKPISQAPSRPARKTIPTATASNVKSRKPTVARKSVPSKSPPQRPMEDPPFATDTADIDMLLSLDKTCIFCGEQDDSFTEEALDLHYWKNCPMLRRCPNCKQVVEISSLTEHLLTECEVAKASGGYVRCPTCTEAISKSTFSVHMEAASCRPASNPVLRCPLCHTDLPPLADPSSPSSFEEAWKLHLMGTGAPGSACPQNTRALQKASAASHLEPKPAEQSSFSGAEIRTFPFLCGY
ncbi:hypothetical protein AAHC03_09576 [Spirometra sp. Aus1]